MAEKKKNEGPNEAPLTESNSLDGGRVAHGKGRVSYSVAGRAIRLAYDRALEANLTGRQRRLLDAVIYLTASWSKLRDSTYKSVLAKHSGIADDSTLKKEIHYLSDELGIIVWIPKAGKLPGSSIVGLPHPEEGGPPRPLGGKERGAPVPPTRRGAPVPSLPRSTQSYREGFTEKGLLGKGRDVGREGREYQGYRPSQEPTR